MARITIPLYYCKSRVPLVVFKAGGDEKHVGIVDTGSEVSMFDWSLTTDGFNPETALDETNFVGVNGEGNATKVSVVRGNVEFRTKNEENHFTLPIVGITYDFSALTNTFRERTKKDISVSAIFGSDFLKENNAKINYRNKTLTIDYETRD